jgi:hypothetical protein
MSEESLKQVAAVIGAKRVNLTVEEARELAKQALKFKQERGRLPSITSPDAWEKRMAEGVARRGRDEEGAEPDAPRGAGHRRLRRNSCASIHCPLASFWKSARSSPRGAVVDVFDGGLMAQPCVSQSSHEASVTSMTDLAIEQEGEPFGMCEAGCFLGCFDLGERLGHSGKAELMQSVEGWMGEQGVVSY